MSARAKSCGPCTFCCKVLAVEELAKPAGTLCGHCAAGCTIYETRPLACRSFECVWLMDPEMPHRFRPDLTRVMLDQDHDGARLIARCDTANPMAWRRGPMFAALKAYATEHWGTGRIAMAVAGRRAWVITPTGEIDAGELEPGAVVSVVEGPDGKVEVVTRPAQA